jgi:hypothetical protein
MIVLKQLSFASGGFTASHFFFGWFYVNPFVIIFGDEYSLQLPTILAWCSPG